MPLPANPFEVLGLDPSTSEEEIVRQAGRLRQRVADEEALNAIRQAVQELTGTAGQRALHALRTHPRPGHRCPTLDRFAAAFRRPPASAAGPASCPPFDVSEFMTLLLTAVAEELDPPPLPFELPASGENAGEVQRQTSELLWQDLLFDTGA